MSTTDEQELLGLTRKLLDAIETSDWAAYSDLCDPAVTAFEPEALGHLVVGMEFHRYYFQLSGQSAQKSTISSPQVRLMGDAAVVTYIRIVQGTDESRRPRSSAFDETRVWQRENGSWRHVHFHRSSNSRGLN